MISLLTDHRSLLTAHCFPFILIFISPELCYGAKGFSQETRELRSLGW